MIAAMRWLTGFLAVVYLVVAVEVPVWAQAQIQSAPQAAAEDYPCAKHRSCGCRTREQCLLHCCCKGQHGSHVKASAQQPSRVSFLAALACQGKQPEAALTVGRILGPHLPPSAAGSYSPPASVFDASGDSISLDSFPADPPEKVPLLV